MCLRPLRLICYVYESEFSKAKWLHEKKQTRGHIVVLGIYLELMLIKSWRFLQVKVLTTSTCISTKKRFCVQFHYMDVEHNRTGQTYYCRTKIKKMLS